MDKFHFLISTASIMTRGFFLLYVSMYYVIFSKEILFFEKLRIPAISLIIWSHGRNGL